MPGEPVPLLISFLYGEEADLQQDPRLARWALAFEDWLSDLQQHFEPSRFQVARAAWHRLLHQQHKPPWQMQPDDIRQHMDWMQDQGYAGITVANSLWMFKKFFTWCSDNQVDPACPSGFNPAAEVKRPQVKLYTNTLLLGREEVDALLDVMRRDQTPLGRRDYAFVLARLSLGVPLARLQELRWGQIELVADSSPSQYPAQQDPAKQDLAKHDIVVVRWQPYGQPSPLPTAVWDALRLYLQASGRLDSIQPAHYIFVPLRRHGKAEPWDRAAGWAEDRFLSTGQFRRGRDPSEGVRARR